MICLRFIWTAAVLAVAFVLVAFFMAGDKLRGKTA